MFLWPLTEELCTKENDKAGCTLTFGGQCIQDHQNFMASCISKG